VSSPRQQQQQLGNVAAADDDEDMIYHRENTRGFGGKTIDVDSNYIKMRTVMGVVINEYVVRFDPAVDSRQVTSLLFQPWPIFFGAKSFLLPPSLRPSSL